MKKYRNTAFYKPNVVQIELVQGCNRRCSFCGTQGFEHKLSFIKKSVLKRECELIAESGYDPRIVLAGHGENTLHPHLYECLSIIREALPKVWIQILSNGYSVRKDPENICKMFDAGINGVTLDEYSDNKFDSDDLTRLVKAYGERTGKNIYCVRMGPGVPLFAPKSSKNYRFTLIPAIDEEQVTVSRKLVTHCGAGMKPNRDCEDKRCTRIFRELSFRWDGWTAMCCNDFRGQYPVINCMDPEVTCFDDIWRHPRYEAARRILYHDRRTFFPCSACNCIPIRSGLLPDHLGKEEMEKPTEKDYKIVLEEHEPLTNIKLRR